MSLDVLYISNNRLEFTKASFGTLVRNTDWAQVGTLWIYDDGSTDGTLEWLQDYITTHFTHRPFNTCIVRTSLGAPAAIMNDYLSFSKADLFAKIDNDVIVPPGWLNNCLEVMVGSPRLDLLGIEPPESRTPHIAGGVRSKCPELETQRLSDGYAPCNSIGGIGLMRRTAFLKHGAIRPHSIYGGFTEWQLANRGVTKGWIVPPLKVFLLDRLPTEPWASLSREYIAKGWQRAWSGYDPAVPFWDWWLECDHGVSMTGYCPPCGRTIEL